MSALERLDSPLTPLRTDVWAASNAHSDVCYQLQVEAEPDSLCRVLNLFALQFLVPHRLNVEQQDDLLSVEIGISGLSWRICTGLASTRLIGRCSTWARSASQART